MTITAKDKRLFEDFIVEVSGQPERAGATLKIFYNIAQKFNAIPPHFQLEVLQLINDIKNGESSAILSKGLQEMSATLLTIAEAETGRTFSTGQLAIIFGVSVTTINNWINAKRFIGFKRGRENQQARISENIIWITPTGKHMAVGEVADLFDKNRERFFGNASNETRQLDRVRYVVETISFFEKRYGGSYAETIDKKGEPDLSEDFIWGREGKEWKSLLREIGDL